MWLSEACQRKHNTPTGCFLSPNVRVRYDNDGWWTLKRQQSLQIPSCVRLTWLVIRPDVWRPGPAQIRVDCQRQEDAVTLIVIDFSTDSFDLFLSKESLIRAFYIGLICKTYYKFVPLKIKPVSTERCLFICDAFHLRFVKSPDTIHFFNIEGNITLARFQTWNYHLTGRVPQ